MTATAFHAARIFDGDSWHHDAALVVQNGMITAITPSAEAPQGPRLDGFVAPGLIDLQVNGGGGVLFNNDPTPEGIAAICAAHARFGTTATMVTLITDRPEVTQAAISAGAASRSAPGFLGLHLEGPHLSLARKGTHDPALIRPMDCEDQAVLIMAAAELPRLIVTLAPESTTPAQVEDLTAAGICVSLGHSDCDWQTAREWIAAGARMVTHLYNAMSQLGHRAPGLVGAGLDSPQIWAGLIADGFHVADASLRVAIAARAGQADGGIFLVSDAMSTIGSDQTGFMLNGRQIFRQGGRLTLQDGTLAGADIALIDAVRYCYQQLGLPLEQSLRLASAHPAAAMGLSDRGHLRPGARADFISLNDRLQPKGTWISGKPIVADPG
ncbi:N-acetylglucosamine-6-phosphate deacetylase [Xinfangfangia sp. D13-10-4-6]|uniref:N-acetylglucosamine-6-phosphate deacetylase n=1 Tax=Pseudogemmobacter hezensis TaxID=2737662 RepID=UPI001556A0DC|nr:N-acetylglucosamine-6-phosphate deacetylase [Pseudogemmobacter hezensis]NPD16011.1 N-acetylglucosamine-6-phosphate deacetylase [Pseudogemmobacter hezensis]